MKIGFSAAWGLESQMPKQVWREFKVAVEMPICRPIIPPGTQHGSKHSGRMNTGRRPSESRLHLSFGICDTMKMEQQVKQ